MEGDQHRVLTSRVFGCHCTGVQVLRVHRGGAGNNANSSVDAGVVGGSHLVCIWGKVKVGSLHKEGRNSCPNQSHCWLTLSFSSSPYKNDTEEMDSV